MKTIQKHTLLTDDKIQTITLKQGFRIVRVEYLVTEKVISLWVESPLRADIPAVQKSFVVKKTNQPVPEDYAHIHTAIDLLKPEAFHLFEVPSDQEHTLTSIPEWKADNFDPRAA